MGQLASLIPGKKSEGLSTSNTVFLMGSLKSKRQTYLPSSSLLDLEVKSSRAALPKSVALPPSYDSFFSFPVRKTGYSGVATYTRGTTVTPKKAEEPAKGRRGRKVVEDSEDDEEPVAAVYVIETSIFKIY